jgi:hypothetical protein
MCLTVFFISKVYCLASFGDENKNKSMIVVTILLSFPPSPLSPSLPLLSRSWLVY